MREVKIIVIAGHGGVDKGARGVVWNGNQIWEADMTIAVRNLICEYMGFVLNEYPEIKVKIIKDDDSHTLQGVINWLNSKVAPKQNRIIYDIHFNAFNRIANGAEVIIPDKATELEKKLAQMLQDVNVSVLKIKDRGVKPESKTARKRLAIMRPIGINVLDEICFIDNMEDMEKFFANISVLVQKKARAILDFANKNL